MKYFFLPILLFFSLTGLSQKKNNTWVFGDYAGLDFNTIPPTSIFTAIIQEEGSASISDDNGQLLFYTNGSSVWNRNHTVMPNGTGLSGTWNNSSCTQSALIIPLPGNNNIYYIFVAPTETIPSPLSYSIVDMSLDGGLGDITADKFVPIYSPSSEKLTATLKSNGVDYWIITKQAGTNAFYVFSFTAAGLDPTPVISTGGFIPNQSERGYCQVSPDGSKLAAVYSSGRVTELLDFNINTGMVSNPVDITLPTIPPSVGTERPYGVAFSPNNSKLYIMQSMPCLLFQYDLLAGSATDIINSATVIFNEGTTQWGGALMLGPDDKLYICFYHRYYVSVINQPNLSGAACNYVIGAIPTNSYSRCELGLPNMIRYATCTAAQHVNNNVIICADQTYQLPSGAIVTDTGIYQDTIRSVNSCDSIITTVHLSVFTLTHINTSAQICADQTYQLPSGTIVNNAGIYQDTIRAVNSCDSIITTVNLAVLALTHINTSAQICAGQSYQLPSGTIVNNAGIYQDTIRAVNSCDSIIITVNLSVLALTHINTSAQICADQTYQLPSGTIVNNAGIYQDTIKSVNSCDSVITTTTLLVNNVSTTSIIDSLSQGQSYTLPWGQIVNMPGVYEQVLQNSMGCDSVVTLTLNLKNNPFDCLLLKNAFTPNGDGINDRWVLFRSACFKRMELNVYNRYGSMLYHSGDYKNDWDGMYKGKNLPDGTYYFLVKTVAFNGREYTNRGNITILR